MDEQRQYQYENDYERRFFEWAGMEVVEAAQGRSTVRLHVDRHHRGGGGTEAVNGGVGAYMFDGILGSAVRSTWDDEVAGQVTMTLTIQYLRPLIADDVVEGRGEVTHRGRSAVYAKGEIYDSQGRVAMRASGIFHLFRHRGE
ncbi:PaaI family thioesterase [Sulfobacillus harzensis]|uniref:PaaI family thioesterase n=1 Tax=Sulfobacillus harzensis TaxID=2729629 RepID=A0A7Y0L0Q8_9FIRM|nr:PaaI family thioesterase [Sulfobacillus harzensis]NMP21100.1 PaaI family thioesterase [Sulfobacillus harzensis]